MWIPISTIIYISIPNISLIRFNTGNLVNGQKQKAQELAWPILPGELFSQWRRSALLLWSWWSSSSKCMWKWTCISLFLWSNNENIIIKIIWFIDSLLKILNRVVDIYDSTNRINEMRLTCFCRNIMRIVATWKNELKLKAP